MSESAVSAVQSFMHTDTLTLGDIDKLRKLVYGSESNRSAMKKFMAKLEGDDSTKRSPAKAYKLALTYWFADRDEDAIGLLGKHLKSYEACVTYVGWCLLKGMFAEAYEKAQHGIKNFGGQTELKLLGAQAAVGCGKLKEAETVAEKVKKSLPELDISALRSARDKTGHEAEAPDREDVPDTEEKSAEMPRHQEHSKLLYLQGLIEEAKANWEQAIEFFDDATLADGENIFAYFRKAYQLDLRGMDEMAVQAYEQARKLRPLHANILFNLAVLYEDIGKNRRAIQCYKTILEDNPNHERARLFLSDAEAARYMVYDEEEEKEQDKLMQVLNTPITDFELSVRSRNCLSKMSILSLGDLSTKTEAELLSYKNFGETSLAEIKALLSIKGLGLGMGSEDFGASAAEEEMDEDIGADENKHDLLDTPLNSVNFSVRCRRAFEKLGLHTLGDLLAIKESGFQGLRNFGQTSLVELKGKLAEYGLTLETD